MTPSSIRARISHWRETRGTGVRNLDAGVEGKRGEVSQFRPRVQAESAEVEPTFFEVLVADGRIVDRKC